MQEHESVGLDRRRGMGKRGDKQAKFTYAKGFTAHCSLSSVAKSGTAISAPSVHLRPLSDDQIRFTDTICPIMYCVLVLAQRYYGTKN